MNENLITILYVRHKHSYDQKMSKQITMYLHLQKSVCINFKKCSIHGIENTSTLYVNFTNQGTNMYIHFFL